MNRGATFWKGSIIVSVCVCLSVLFNKKLQYISKKIDPIPAKCSCKNCNFRISNMSFTRTYSEANTSVSNLKDNIFGQEAKKSEGYTSNSCVQSSLTPQTKKTTGILKHNFKENVFVSFRINNNLYSDARKSGVPQNVISKIISLYKNIINFKADLKEGDIVNILYRKKEAILLFSSINNRKKERCIYGYSHGGNFGYYDDSGICLDKNTFLIPVKGAKVSSKFGLRIHPVKKIKKIHNGTDFAASAGTPIVASNSGKIVYIGKRGGYGKCIIIRHDNNYKTLYGHMSKYAQNSFVNKMVHKGDVIGYVGKTGIATGPHLHFEIMKNNTRIDPEKANMVSVSNLTKLEKFKFETYKRNIKTKIGLLRDIF